MSGPAAPPAAGRSVSRGLTGAFATFVALLLLVGATGLLGFDVVTRAREREVRLGQLRAANTAMLLAFTSAETGVRGYRLSQDRSFLEPYEAGRVDFAAQVAQAMSVTADEQERVLVRRQAAVARRWFAGYAEPVAALPPGQAAVTPAATLAHKSTADRYRAANASLDALAQDRAESARAVEAATTVRAATVTALALALALVVALATHRRSLRALGTPLGAVVAVLGDLAAGDSAARADTGSGPAEVRVLARSVNELADEADRLRRERTTLARAGQLGVEIGRSIRDTLVDGDPVVEALTRVGSGLGADRAYVRLVEGPGLGAIEREWHLPHLAPLAGTRTTAPGQAHAGDWARAMYLRSQPAVVDDLRAARGQDAALDAFTGLTGASAALMVPVGAGDQVLGVLYLLSHAGPRRWAEHEVALATSVAADLGRALVLTALLGQQRQMVAQLRDLDRVKTDFLSAVSHELRTPLTSIAGYLELIRDGDAGAVPPEVEAMLAVVERNTTRLQGLIEDLLTLSRIESGTSRIVRADVVVDDVVDGAAERARPAALRGGVVLDVVSGEDLVVRADVVQLERALGGLVGNAVKFTPAGGRVEVRTRSCSGWAEVSVTDTGIGIPSEEQVGVFSRFFRASNATARAIPGTGLGLTIARSIVENHGGELRLRSVQDEGTTITVRLPLVGSSRAARSAPAQQAGGAR